MFCCTFFFFKQKTAYDMRISDWSSDVCSSDLPARQIALPHLHISGKHGPVLPVLHLDAVGVHIHRLLAVMTLQHGNGLPHGGRRQGKEKAGNQQSRSEEHTSELQSLIRISYAVFCLQKKQLTSRSSKYTLIN